MRTMAARGQTLQSPASVASQMFVASFPADPKLLAQLRHRKSRTLRQHHELNYFFHRGYIFPSHSAQKCNPSPRLVCYLSRRFVPSLRDIEARFARHGLARLEDNYAEK